MQIHKRFENREERWLIREFTSGFNKDFSENDLAIMLFSVKSNSVLYCTKEHGFSVWTACPDGDSEGNDVYFEEDIEAALKYFESETSGEIEPNWEAQAEYDELHGTINGEDARIVQYRELVGEE